MVKQTTEFMKKTFRETTTTKTKAPRRPIVTVRSDVRPVGESYISKRRRPDDTTGELLLCS